MTWGVVLAWLTSVAFGVVSAIVPVVNAEVYVLASQMSAVAGVIPVAVGVGIGQTIGKCLLFSGVRRGKQFRFVREHRARARTRERGRFGQGVHDALQLLLRLVGTKRWGLPITLLAAVVGFPPLYAVALLAVHLPPVIVSRPGASTRIDVVAGQRRRVPAAGLHQRPDCRRRC